jgi:hypothetical protein
LDELLAKVGVTTEPVTEEDGVRDSLGEVTAGKVTAGEVDAGRVCQRREGSRRERPCGGGPGRRPQVLNSDVIGGHDPRTPTTRSVGGPRYLRRGQQVL